MTTNIVHACFFLDTSAKNFFTDYKIDYKKETFPVPPTYFTFLFLSSIFSFFLDRAFGQQYTAFQKVLQGWVREHALNSRSVVKPTSASSGRPGEIPGSTVKSGKKKVLQSKLSPENFSGLFRYQANESTETIEKNAETTGLVLCASPAPFLSFLAALDFALSFPRLHLALAPAGGPTLCKRLARWQSA